MSVLVSIHDVTPANERRVHELWELCRARGATPALLVVPEWHGEWPLEDHPRFAAWLRERAAESAEILLHGERHDEMGSPRRPADHLRALGRTDGEGEFLTLGPEAARVRIARGVARLRALGLEPIGFVPPAWLGSPAVHRAAGELGLGVSEDSRSVWLFPPLAPAERRLRSPVLCWSGRSPARAWASSAVVAARSSRVAPGELLRIALHPADLDHRATAGAAARTLERWMAREGRLSYVGLGRTAAAPA
ncbi:MAG TPA: DUF2334 domain-containing protein [Planctomycetota bacterium]|nr:DUF2334 domain-containing protein [Planctomycetota bacterium]